MNTLPFFLGPINNWDPQGYNDEEELEDELMTAGMTIKDDNEEDEEDEEADEEDEFNEEDEEDEEADEEDEDYDQEMVDPIAALDDLADQVNREERETLKFKDFDE